MKNADALLKLWFRSSSNRPSASKSPAVGCRSASDRDAASGVACDLAGVSTIVDGDDDDEIVALPDSTGFQFMQASAFRKQVFWGKLDEGKGGVRVGF